MTVRPATLADLDVWVRFRRAVYDGDPDARREIPILLEDPDQHAFVVVEGDRVLGFVEVRLRNFAEGCSTSPVGYIEGLRVEPGARRHGHASALIRAAEAWAVEHGCSEMASDTALDNHVSLAFHAALGYVEVDRVICLRKRLVPGTAARSTDARDGRLQSHEAADPRRPLTLTSRQGLTSMRVATQS